MLRASVNYGLYSGFSSFALVLMIYFIGKNPLGNLNWIGVWIPVVFICLGTISFRNIEKEGFLTYGEGLGVGLMISVIAGLSGSILIYILIEFIDKNILVMHINESLEQMDKAEEYMSAFLSDEMYQKMVEQLEKIKAGDIALSNFYTKVFGGGLISLVTAAVYRKKKPMFEDVDDLGFRI